MTEYLVSDESLSDVPKKNSLLEVTQAGKPFEGQAQEDCQVPAAEISTSSIHHSKLRCHENICAVVGHLLVQQPANHLMV